MSGTLHLAQAQSNRGAGGRKTGLSGCRTIGEASGGPGAHLELCARRRAATLTDGDAPQVPDHAQPRAAAQSIGIAAGRSAHQALQPRLGSARHQRTTHAAGLGRRRNGSRDAGGARGPAFTRDAATNCRDAFRACATLHPVYRRLLKLTLEELRLIEDHLGELDQQMAAAPRCIITMRSSASPKSRGWASIPRSRSLRKSAPPPRRFLHRSISRRGWAPALGARRVRARTTVIAAPRATARCDGSSIRPPTPP